MRRIDKDSIDIDALWSQKVDLDTDEVYQREAEHLLALELTARKDAVIERAESILELVGEFKEPEGTEHVLFTNRSERIPLGPLKAKRQEVQKFGFAYVLLNRDTTLEEVIVKGRFFKHKTLERKVGQVSRVVVSLTAANEDASDLETLDYAQWSITDPYNAPNITKLEEFIAFTEASLIEE